MRDEITYIDGFKSKNTEFSTKHILLDIGGVYLDVKNLRHLEWLIDELKNIHDSIVKDRNAESNK